MTFTSKNRISRVIGLTAAILLLFGASAFPQIQGVSPLSDYQYKQDYAEYQEIKKEADTQKRADLLLSFLKKRPINRMLLYVATDYLETVKPYIDKKDWAKAVAMQEALQSLIVSEKTVKSADIPVGVDDFLKNQLAPTNKLILSALLQSYYQSNNLPKAAETAEKLYALEPSNSMLPLMTDIYQKTKNTDKYVYYAEKLLGTVKMEDPQGYGTALQLAQIYLQRQNVPKATELLTKVMNVYGDKVPPGTQEAAWNATRAFAYGIIAAGIYGKKDYTKAQELYEKVAKFDPKRDDAYYYIGMCKWNKKDQEGAIEAFAKSAVLNKDYAQRARKYLEDLYKAEHSDSLDGIDDVLAKAKSELGVS
jgi:tetratricopeptide (TPR) repeat protein